MVGDYTQLQRDEATLRSVDDGRIGGGRSLVLVVREGRKRMMTNLNGVQPH